MPVFTFNSAGKIKPMKDKGTLLPSKIFGSPIEYVKDLKSYYYSLILGAVDWIVTECPLEKRSSMLKNVNSNRKQIHLTREEWKESSLGQKIKWLCSLPGVNIPSLRIRHFLSRIKLIKD